MVGVMVNAGLVSILLAQLSAGATQSEWSAHAGPPGAWVYVVLTGFEKIESCFESTIRHSGGEAMKWLRNQPDQMRRDLARKLNVPAHAIDPSKPMAFAVFSPLAGRSVRGQWPVAVIVPVRGEPQGIDLVNGYAVVMDSVVFATRVRGILQSAGNIEAPEGIARVYVDFSTMLQTIGQGIEAQIALAVSPGGVPNATRRTKLMVFGALFSLLDQIENLTLSIDISGDTAQVSAHITPKWGTDMAQLASNQMRGNVLGNVVPNGVLTISGELKGMSGWLLGFTEQFLKIIPNPKEADTIRKPLSCFLHSLGDEFAFTYDLGPQGLSVDIAARFKGSIEVVREYYRLMASYKLPQELAQRMGVKPVHVDLALKEGAHQADGVVVDQLTMKFNVQEGIPPIHTFGLLGLLLDAPQQALPLWESGEVITNYAVVNDTLVMTMGGKNSYERISTLVLSAKSPSGSAGDAPLKFRVDVLELLKFVMKARSAVRLVAPEGGGKPLTGTVEFAGPTITMQITLPLKIVVELANLMDVLSLVRTPSGPDGAPRP